MRQKSVDSKAAADKLIKNIRRKTTRHYSAQQKNHLALAGLRGEESIAALCRREGIAESLYMTNAQRAPSLRLAKASFFRIRHAERQHQK